MYILPTSFILNGIQVTRSIKCVILKNKDILTYVIFLTCVCMNSTYILVYSMVTVHLIYLTLYLDIRFDG
jgi:hypothetical protein